jgi:hypothetical protein
LGGWKLEGKNHFGDTEVDGNVILKGLSMK